MTQPFQKKQAKIEELICDQCSKRFPSYSALHAHEKNKHKPVESKITKQENDKENSEEAIAKKNKDISKNSAAKGKNFQQHQQDLEDRIYAFLGELGQKHFEANQLQDKDEKLNQSNNNDEDRMMGQANYLENNIIRTPFELEFSISKELEGFEVTDPDFKEQFELFNNETLALHDKLSIERDKWEFRDPIQIKNIEEQEFSLINVVSVLRNYKKRNINLEYPQYCVFLLWLAKICKPAAWREFGFIVGCMVIEYENYRNKSTGTKEKNQTSWKKFSAQYIEKMADQIPPNLQTEIRINEKEDVVAYLKLYAKWVTYFDLF